jgi:prephenate dehydratase
MRTAFLGPRGTFTEEAAVAYAGDESDFLAFSTIPALTAAVETGLADKAVLPIENSIEGSISTTLDLLIHETPLRICAEVVVPIRMFLVTAPGATLTEIRVVTSKPEAFGQCRKFLDRCLPNVEQRAALSTAAAVQDVSNGTDLTIAAIGPGRAAELYSGQVLAHDIQDTHSNVTRFAVLASEDAKPTGKDKTSIGFTVKQNVPGALHEILSALAEETIQMTMVYSRPTKAWLGDYVFLIDFEGHREDAHVARALAKVEERCSRLEIFGSYPQFPMQTLADLAESSGFPAGT